MLLIRFVWVNYVKELRTHFFIKEFTKGTTNGTRTFYSHANKWK